MLTTGVILETCFRNAAHNVLQNHIMGACMAFWCITTELLHTKRISFKMIHFVLLYPFCSNKSNISLSSEEGRKNTKHLDTDLDIDLMAET